MAPAVAALRANLCLPKQAATTSHLSTPQDCKIVPSQAFSGEKHQFFAGQSLHPLQQSTSRRTFQRATTVNVEAYTKPYTKVATSLVQLETATEPPLNTSKNKEPYIGTIKFVKRIVGPNAPGETCHIVIDHDVPYWEGQSYGIIPPGENPKKPGMPNSVHLYSIASTRYGDDFDGRTVSLCVRRAVYWDPETGKEDLSKKAICSNFLCDSRPGDKVQITGKVLLERSCCYLKKIPKPST